MGKREDLQAQLEQAQAALADLDENDYECEVTVDGKATRVSGSTAKNWLTKIGLIDKPAESDGDGDGAGDGDGDQDAKPKSGSKFFA